MPGPSGESRADTNAKFNQSHKTPDPPELPDEVEHVWQWFWELSAQRRSGPEPIGWDDIGRWASLTGNDPTPEEVSMILAMDAAFRVAVRDLQKGGTKRTKPDAPPKKAFSAIKA